MFGVYFQLCCRWSVEAWSKWQISCRRHSQMHCLWTNVDAYIVEYRWFLFLRVWLTNIGPIVRGQFPLLRVIYQGRLNIGRKVTASQSGSGTYIYMFTGSIHLTNLIPGTGGVYILIDQLPQWGPWKHGVVATRMFSVPKNVHVILVLEWKLQIRFSRFRYFSNFLKIIKILGTCMILCS